MVPDNTYACMYDHVCTHTHIYIYLYLYVYLYLYLFVYLSIHPSIYLSIVIFKMQPFHKTTMNSLTQGFPGIATGMAQADDGKVSSQNVTRAPMTLPSI